MKDFQLSKQAKQDLDDIWYFIALRNPINADRYLNRMISIFRLLAETPKIGRFYTRKNPSLLYHPFDDYRIFYQEKEHGIEISRVINRYRNIRNIIR